MMNLENCGRKRIVQFLRKTHKDLESRCPKMNLLDWFLVVCVCESIVKTDFMHNYYYDWENRTEHRKARCENDSTIFTKTVYCQISGTNENIGASAVAFVHLLSFTSIDLNIFCLSHTKPATCEHATQKKIQRISKIFTKNRKNTKRKTKCNKIKSTQHQLKIWLSFRLNWHSIWFFLISELIKCTQTIYMEAFLYGSGWKWQQKRPLPPPSSCT